MCVYLNSNQLNIPWPGKTAVLNHILLIDRAKEPLLLSYIVHDFKKFTANQLLPLKQQPAEAEVIACRWAGMMKRFEF